MSRHPLHEPEGVQGRPPLRGHGRPLKGVAAGQRSRASETHLTRVFKALSDGTRQEILRLLEGSQRTIGEMEGNLHLSQPTIHRHLSVLKEANLIVDQTQGKDTAYRLNSDILASSLQEFFDQFRSVSVFPSVPLPELHDPATGRLDAARFAEYLGIPLRRLAEAMGKNYSAVHKTPSSPTLQPFLRSVKRSLEILAETYPHRIAVLSWLNEPHPELGRRTPLEVILEGLPDAVEDMLEAALVGIPS